MSVLRVLFAAAVLACGAFAQDTCVSSNDVTFEQCTTFSTTDLMEIGVFWNYDAEAMTIDLLFEGTLDGWLALGFSPLREAGMAMSMSNVVVGCTTTALDAATADYLLESKADAALNVAVGNQELSAYATGTVDGTCWTRFTRPFAPAGVDALENLGTGEDVRVVVAHGDAAGDLAQHAATARTFVDMQFAPSDDGDDGDDGDDDDNEDDDGAASSLTARALPVVVALATAVTAFFA